MSRYLGVGVSRCQIKERGSSFLWGGGAMGLSRGMTWLCPAAPALLAAVGGAAASSGRSLLGSLPYAWLVGDWGRRQPCYYHMK